MFGTPNLDSSAHDTSAAPPTLAVIVPATDDPATLPHCLAALARAGAAPEDVVVVREPGRTGPAAARNAGAGRTAADVLVFVDSDVEVQVDALVRVRAAFAADAGLTALFGAYDDAPAAAGVVSEFRNLLHHHVHSAAAGPVETFWAGLGAVRREAFLSVGGFDAARFPHPSVEDIELGMRLAAAGARIGLDPRVRGRHLKRWTLRDMVVTDFRRRGVPWVQAMLRARHHSSALNLGWRHRLSALASLWVLGALLRRRPTHALGAATGMVALNRDFYGLLARRLGVVGALAGVGLHAIHHLTAVAAVPAGLVTHVLVGAANGR